MDNNDLDVAAGEVCGLMPGISDDGDGCLCVWVGVDHGDHHKVHVEGPNDIEERMKLLNHAVTAIERVRDRLILIQG